VGVSSTRDWVDVLLGDGVLRVFEVIPLGSAEPMPAARVIRSTRATLGLSRLGLLRRIIELEERFGSPISRTTGE